MTRTDDLLALWSGGQADSERLSAHILLLDGYRDIDPSHPTGGPDGGADIQCSKKGARCVAACYFAHSSVSFGQIRAKFKQDLKKAAARSPKPSIFLFLTNQKITLHERRKLRKYAHQAAVTTQIYHRERIARILDDPRGYGARYQFLGKELTPAESASFYALFGEGIVAAINRLGQSLSQNHKEILDILKPLPTMLAQIAQSQTNLAAQVQAITQQPQARPKTE